MQDVICIAEAAVLSLACLVLNSMFLGHMEKLEYRKAFWLKGAASLCFLCVGMTCAMVCKEYDYVGKVLMGLFMGLVGDHLLAARYIRTRYHDQLFTAGAVAFIGGHFCYLWALFGMLGRQMLILTVIVGAVLSVISVAFQLRHKFSAGKLAAGGFMYLVIVSFMGAASVAAAACTMNPAFLLFAAGGICFVISDNTLCVYCFGGDRRPVLNTVVHVTYYAAQLLIAWSMFVL